MTNEQTTIEQNDSLLRGYQIDAGLAFPVTTENAFAFAGALGYDVDRPWLNNVFRAGQLDRPEKASGLLQWTFENVVALTTLLEKCRRWSAGHPRHVEKLTEAEYQKHHNELSVVAGKMVGWSELNPTQLMNVLVNEDSKSHRLAVASIFMSKLGSQQE